MDNAMTHVANNELNISLKLESRFIGVFEHFYDDRMYQHTMLIWLMRLK